MGKTNFELFRRNFQPLVSNMPVVEIEEVKSNDHEGIEHRPGKWAYHLSRDIQ